MGSKVGSGCSIDQSNEKTSFSELGPCVIRFSAVIAALANQIPHNSIISTFKSKVALIQYFLSFEIPNPTSSPRHLHRFVITHIEAVGDR